VSSNCAWILRKQKVRSQFSAVRLVRWLTTCGTARLLGLLSIYRYPMYIVSGRSRMMPVDLSVLDLLRLDHRLVWAPTSTTYEGWVAAGKPCLRQNCGHHHGSHIPSEGMECNECDCLGFVNFAHTDDSGATSAIRSPTYPKRRRRKFADAQLGFSSPTDPNRARLPLSRKGSDHDRHNC
jgi:hypothetical protein